MRAPFEPKAVLRRYYVSTGTDDDVAKRLASRFSGHSGRVGFVVAAKEAGAADSDIAVTSVMSIVATEVRKACRPPGPSGSFFARREASVCQSVAYHDSVVQFRLRQSATGLAL